MQEKKNKKRTLQKEQKANNAGVEAHSPFA
jgi:hypothetical protein